MTYSQKAANSNKICMSLAFVPELSLWERKNTHTLVRGTRHFCAHTQCFLREDVYSLRLGSQKARWIKNLAFLFSKLLASALKHLCHLKHFISIQRSYIKIFHVKVMLVVDQFSEVIKKLIKSTKWKYDEWINLPNVGQMDLVICKKKKIPMF